MAMGRAVDASTSATPRICPGSVFGHGRLTAAVAANAALRFVFAGDGVAVWVSASMSRSISSCVGTGIGIDIGNDSEGALRSAGSGLGVPSSSHSSVTKSWWLARSEPEADDQRVMKADVSWLVRAASWAVFRAVGWAVSDTRRMIGAGRHQGGAESSG